MSGYSELRKSYKKAVRRAQFYAKRNDKVVYFSITGSAQVGFCYPDWGFMSMQGVGFRSLRLSTEVERNKFVRKFWCGVLRSYNQSPDKRKLP